LGIEKSEAALGYASQQISGKEAVLQGNPNALAGIDGKISGVQVVQASGTPGASAQIMIRGISSVSDSEPLIVVDGVPISNSSKITREAVYGTGGTDKTSRAVDINPEDIESMTVLKGPAAAVLYGSRAQNGVIVYTTKKGKAGGLSVNFSTSVGMDFVRNLPKMQTKYGQGFGTYDPLTGDFTWDKNTTNYSHSWGPILDGQDYTIGKNTYSGQKYDNFKDFFKIGINQDYNLSLQGGTDKVKTLFSLGYTNMTGIIPDNTFQRFSLRSTTNAQLTDIFHLEIGANLVNSGGNKSQKGSNVSGVSLPLYRMPVNYHGAQGAGDNAMYRTDYDNPFWSAKNIRYEDDVWRFVGSTKLSYDMDKSKRIFDVAKLSYAPSIDLVHYHLQHYTAQKGSVTADYRFGRMQEVRRVDMEINNDLTLFLSKQLPKDFNIDFLLGFSFRRNTYSYVEVDGRKTTDYTFLNIDAMAEKKTEQVSSYANFLALYGDLTTSWKNMLFLGLAFRNEWTSALPYAIARNRQGFQYPAANISFVFTELSENRKFGALSFGKVRASFGVTGLMPSPYSGITPVQALSGVWDPSLGNFPATTNQGTNIISFGTTFRDPNIKPEQKIGYELGVDLRFFAGRLTIDATIYQESIKGSILPIATEPASGFSAIYGNAIDLRNRGIEFTIGGVPVAVAGFEWNTSLNITHNSNIVTDIHAELDQVGGFGFSNSVKNYLAVGKPAYALYGFAWQKNEDGQLLTDKSGNYILNTDDWVYLGNPFPKVLLGWNNQFTYKGFSLRIFTHIRIGGDMYNGTIASLKYWGRALETLDREGDVLLAGIDKETGLANQTPISKQEYWRVVGSASHEAIEKDINWIKLRELGVGYTWNLKNPKYKLKSFGLNVTATNLAMWTNYSGGMDPETSLGGGGGTSGASVGYEYFNNPNTRSFLVGLKLNF
jgi:TonB-linked SusC/RagA family outer membrane protein